MTTVPNSKRELWFVQKWYFYQHQTRQLSPKMCHPTAIQEPGNLVGGFNLETSKTQEPFRITVKKTFCFVQFSEAFLIINHQLK